MITYVMGAFSLVCLLGGTLLVFMGARYNAPMMQSLGYLLLVVALVYAVGFWSMML